MAGHARVHTSSTARRTSAAITRRRYFADPRESLSASIRSAYPRRDLLRLAVAQVRELLRRLGHRADDHPQPVAVHRRDGRARPVLGRARAELAVRRPLRLRRHPHLDEQLVGLDARLVVAEDQLPDRDRAVAARRAQDARGRRARRASPAGPTRSRHRRARRRPSPGCARAGWPPARTRAPAPASRRTRSRSTRRCETIAPSRSSPSTTSICLSSSTPAERQQRGRRQESLVHEDAQKRPAREHRRLVTALGAQRERLLEGVGCHPFRLASRRGSRRLRSCR